MRRLLTCVLVVALAHGCKFPPPPDVSEDGSVDAQAVDAQPISDAGPDYLVGGTVTGLWSGASVALQLLSIPDAPSTVTVATNGEFHFERRLPAGRAFTVSVVPGGQPFKHTCTVVNPNGTIQSEDVVDVTLQCVAEVSIAVTFSAPLALDFNPNASTQSAGEVSAGVQQTRVTVTAPDATALSLNGHALSSGSPSPVVPLEVGDNGINLNVVIGPISKTFEIAVTRDGAAVTQGIVYGKSSNSGAGDNVSIVAGDHMFLVVGAPGEDSAATGVNQNENSEGSQGSGAAYVFRRAGATWTQEAYLKPSVNGPNARFGASLAFRADDVSGAAVLAVGAPGASNSAGAVYVFTRTSAGVWSEAQIVVAPSGTQGDEFGASVALAQSGVGMVLAVGSPNNDTSVAGDSGAVHVFRRATPNGFWVLEKFLKASNAEAGDHFGARVSITANRLVVSAPDEDSAGTGVGSNQQSNNGAPGSGAVYVFDYAAGDWRQTAYVKASNTGAGDRFGAGLSLSTDEMAVGAPGEDSDGTGQTNEGRTDSGAVYVFAFGGAWSQAAYLKPSVNYDGAMMGFDVAIRGDLVIAGATEDGVAYGNGAAFLFRRGVAGWTSTAKPVRAPNEDDLNDGFGSSVCLTGQSIAVGAPREDGDGRGFSGVPSNNGAGDSGAFYVLN